jgi:phenylalanyl-tRNA synthetase alpha chain
MDLAAEAEVLREAARTRLEGGSTATQVRRGLFGTNGSYPELLKQIKDLPPTERAAVGSRLAAIRTEIETLLMPDKIAKYRAPVDASVPAASRSFGTVHPISAMIEHMVNIFARLSFEVVEGPEIVGEAENFEWLNIGQDHPARDGHDSFFVGPKKLLRTHTTAVQVLEMRRRKKLERLPIRVVVPGKTYRRESDATHSPMFHQFDAVMVDTQTTFSDLRGCLEYFASELFGEAVETRFRPHHFPFTEPSAEIDIRWKGAEGRLGRWLEFGGCGMIHPEVLRRAGFNPGVWRGWAFGMGVERPVMVKYGLPDVRALYDNALPFLNQFPGL